MTIKAALTHKTRYNYDKLINLGPQTVRLRPAPHSRTPIESYGITVEPAEHFLNWQQDPFGNYMARLVFPERTQKFEVCVELIANLTPINAFDFFVEEAAQTAPFLYDAAVKKDLTPYLAPVEGGPLFEKRVVEELAFWQGTPGVEQLTIDYLVAINQRLANDISYTIRMEPGVQTPEETLTKKRGSCRDTSWLLAALLRRLGVASRFVSGYLIQLKADIASLDGPSGPSEDFTDLHAWTEAYIPGAGWVGLDPTSGLFAAEGHIPLAATPSPQSAAAIDGGLEPCEVEFDFEMSVKRLYEAPRVTLPYNDDQWRAVVSAGQEVDKILLKDDVRLTMGGEPTFVADQDRDAGEWNIDAVGPTKRAYADQLIRKLRERFAPDGLLQYGQGKWYPGEQLPRWAFALYWRDDNEPLWEDANLIAKEDVPQNATYKEAAAFTNALCETLGIEAECAAPAYEDPAAFMMREANLPENLDPENNKLEDPQERKRLMRVFERGITAPVAMVLPIQAAQARAKRKDPNKNRRAFKWVSEKWRTRRGKLYLHPGDSPVGFRLPLNSLTWLDPANRPEIIPLDPFAARGALPTPRPRFQTRTDGPFTAGPSGGGTHAPANDETLLDDGPESDEDIAAYERWRAQREQTPMEDVPPGGFFYGAGPEIRTALSVEPRDGVVNVFLPPVRSADEFVDLIAAIEESAEIAGVPINIEGYPPPEDPRLKVIKVTPDPGVVEVNIHPSASWKEQVAITEALYEAARECRLEASKFMLDGRPTGSGGGAHIVVGGATPADSPFLRRPDVLASLLRYWQNHPSLSYFFAGMFIGPTSQAPRVDEGRYESLYELEIALSQIPNPLTASNADCPPWLVDRLFRHLLTDVSGNTHRSEICIDKLYSPDGPTGRLGLVEFRAFEMPPHPRMNLAQQLLLRALIAWFWRKPYTEPLIRFGTDLHDRYLLPYFLHQDLCGVLQEITDGLGVALDPAWFDAQYEFRFPLLGMIEAEGMRLELRSALELWHVLGEENAGGGTARFVDSSVERVEARIYGLDGDRYQLACNGVRVPLSDIEAGQKLAGVRFRTWLPESCLHPTIAPQGPLTFDIFDTWNNQSIGGCVYHAVHPGGRNFETQPVNALEADGRRKARFFPFTSAPGSYVLREPPASPEFPTTLDLRRVV